MHAAHCSTSFIMIEILKSESSLYALCQLAVFIASHSSRLGAVPTSSDGGLEEFKAYPVFKEIETLLQEV